MSEKLAQAPWMQLAALALTGSLAGGGVSYATQPGKELAALKASVDTVAVAVVELKAELRAERRDIGRLEEEVKDLKERVRAVEMAK